MFKFKTNVKERKGLEGPEFTVEVICVSPKVDRPHSYGFCTSKPRLRDRLVRAIEAGVVTVNPSVATDINGKTYISFTSAVMGKHLNANLKRLGY